MLQNGHSWLWIYEHPKTFILGMVFLIVALTLVLGGLYDLTTIPRPSTGATLERIEQTMDADRQTMDADRLTLQALVTQVNK